MKFYTWLMHNRWRADPIGDLARDVHADKEWSKAANSWRAVQKAMPSAASDKARKALRSAWSEYELYVGGASQLKPGTWVIGVLGATYLKEVE